MQLQPLTKQRATKTSMSESITIHNYIVWHTQWQLVSTTTSLSLYYLLIFVASRLEWKWIYEGSSISLSQLLALLCVCMKCVYQHLQCMYIHVHVVYFSTESREWIQRCLILRWIAVQGCVFPYSPLLKSIDIKKRRNFAVNSSNVNLWSTAG